MTNRHLEIFITVAGTLSMTTAAEKLFIAQPSVSQAISDLERHLKTKLLERFGTSLRLTDAGAEFLAYARHIVSLTKEAEKRMLDRQRGGSLRIGGSMTTGAGILTQLIQDFKIEEPHCNVTFTVDNTATLEKELLADRIDIAFVEGTMKSRYLISKAIMEDELVLICSIKHAFAGNKFVKAADLAGEGYIIREEGSGTRKLFESVMSLHGIDYAVKGVVNNAEGIKLAVSEGLGISVISSLSIDAEVKRKELCALKIKDVNFRRYFSLYYHKNKYITLDLKKFMEVCEKHRK